MPYYLNNIGTTYSVNDIIDKTLIAKKKVEVYDSPNLNRQKLYDVQPSGTVGVVYSWVNKNGSIWWQLYPGNKFVIHDANSFSLQALQDQGVVSTREQLEAEAEKNKPWYEKIAKSASKIIITLGVIAGVSYIIANKKFTK